MTPKRTTGKTTFTVTHPDGTTSQRSSKRAVSHAVVRGPVDVQAWVDYHVRAQQRLEADQRLFATALEEGKFIIEAMFPGAELEADLEDYATHHVWLKGVPESSQAANRKGMVLVQGQAVPAQRLVRTRVRERLEEAVAAMAEHAHAAKNPPPERWEVLSWSSRRDLAVKALDRAQEEWGVRGYRVRVVEVD